MGFRADALNPPVIPLEKTMNDLKSSAVLAAALLAASSAAFAGAGIVTTTVAPLADIVTYSTVATPALKSYIGYTVAIGNGGGNTINHIRFTGTTSVAAADEAAEFDPTATVGATCAADLNPPGAPANARTITCTVGAGQLAAGQPFPTFAVFFKAPVKGGAPLTTPDTVSFSGTTYYAETNSGGNPLPNSALAWSTGPVTLGTNNPTLVRSAVTKNGGTLFTGKGNGTDIFSTSVVVPPVATYTTARIEQSTFTTGCTNFTTCYASQLTIPPIPGTIAFTPYLTIVLRQDATNIKPGTRIESVLIEYLPDGTPPPLYHAPYYVGLCASPTTPRDDGLPCIAKPPVYYKNSKVPGWTPALNGDFEWTLINKKNGGYKVF